MGYVSSLKGILWKIGDDGICIRLKKLKAHEEIDLSDRIDRAWKRFFIGNFVADGGSKIIIENRS